MQASVAAPPRSNHTEHDRRDTVPPAWELGSRGHGRDVPPPGRAYTPPLSASTPHLSDAQPRRTRSTTRPVAYTPRLTRPNCRDTTLDISPRPTTLPPTLSPERPCTPQSGRGNRADYCRDPPQSLPPRPLAVPRTRSHLAHSPVNPDEWL